MVGLLPVRLVQTWKVPFGRFDGDLADAAGDAVGVVRVVEIGGEIWSSRGHLDSLGTDGWMSFPEV